MDGSTFWPAALKAVSVRSPMAFLASSTRTTPVLAADTIPWKIGTVKTADRAMPVIMILLRPTRSDRAPKTTNNGMPSRMAMAMTIRASVFGSRRIVSMKNRA